MTLFHFSRLFPGLENCSANFKTFSIIQESIRTIKMTKCIFSNSGTFIHFQWAVYKSGTGTKGRGHRDVCVGTWDLGMQDEGLEDIKT